MKPNNEDDEVFLIGGNPDILALQKAEAQLAHEVSERREAEDQVRHLNAVLWGMRHVNQLIVREKDREKLIQGVCDSLIETRGFASAWIGLTNQDDGLIMAVQAGLGEAFVPIAEAQKRGECTLCARKVLRQAGVVVLDVSRGACSDCPLAARYGAQNVLAVRLGHGTRVYGLLVVSFRSDIPIDKEEEPLLAEIAADLAFALHGIEQEGALRNSKAQLSNAMEIARLGYWEYDVANDLFTFDDHFYSVFRTSVEEIGAYTLSSARYAELFVYPDDRPIVAAEVKKAIETTDPNFSRQLEHRIVFADGEIGWISVRFFIVKDDEGRTVRTYGANQNITERKRAEEALRQRASQLALLDEIGRKVTALLDLDQVLTQAAQLVQDFFGFHHVGLFTKANGEDRLVMRAKAGDFAHLFPPDHSVPLGEGLVGWVGLHGETLLANDVETEPRYLNPYPDHLPTRSELSVPIRIGDEIVGVLDLQSPQLNAFTLSDVTTEETLASQVAVAINNARLYSEAERRNRDLSLLNQVIAATAAAASLGVTSMLNVICRELVRAFEVPQSAAVLLEEGKQNAVVVAEYLTEARRSALGTNIPLNDNPMYLYLKENKTPLVIEDAEANLRIGALHDLVHMRGTASLLIVPLLVDGEVEGGLVIEFLESRHFSARDVDLARRVAEQVSSFLARARLEEQRQQLEEQFLQAQKLEAVGRLAGGIAHDFNNLLTIIHLSTRLMERQLHPEDPLAEQVRRIQDADRRATGLTQQLLAFSRREIVEPHLLDLNEVITNLNPMLRRIIGEDVELRSILARDLWTVKIDPSQMDQVLFNLAVNARDAMPTGGRLIVETANVILDRAYTMRHLDVEPGEYVLLSISDTGEGMDEEVKAHIFEPFFTTKEKGKGTGLGLATVHGIVKQNQGHIWVYSELGVGTTFKIYLPHVSEGVRAPTALPVEGVAAQGTETLLLVEDEAEVRELTRDILAALGYQVLMAEDGVQALQVAAEHDGPIHLLLTDVVMPGMSGRTLADELLSSHPEMRVLYVSGYTDNAIVHHGVLTEGTNFLSKPFDLETLAHRVRTVLDGQA